MNDTELNHLSEAFSNFFDFFKEREEENSKLLKDYLPEFAKQVKIKVDENEIFTNYDNNFFYAYEPILKQHLENFHSDFLAYLLNFDGGIGLHEKFRELFIKELQKINSKVENLSISKVEREHRFKKAEANNIAGGSIDIFIETKENVVILIENKIRAEDDDDQLENYNAFATKLKSSEKIYDFVLFYLTPRGVKSRKAETTVYTRLSYTNTILPWLKKCMEYAQDIKPDAAHGVKSYIKTLELEIYQHQITKNMEDIKKLFENNKDNLYILKYWSEIQDAVTEKQSELKDNMFPELKNHIISKNPTYKKIITFDIAIEKNVVFYGLLFTKKSDKNFLKEYFQEINKILRNDIDNCDQSEIWTWKFLTNLDDKLYYDLSSDFVKTIKNFKVEIDVFLNLWLKIKEELESTNK